MIFPTIHPLHRTKKWGWVGLGILQIRRQVKWENDPRLLLTYILSLSRQSQRTYSNVIYDGPANCLTTFHRFELFPHETPKITPNGSQRPNLFSLCLFPGESADMCKMWWQSVQPFSNVPRFLNFRPTKKKAPWGIEGLIVFSLCPLCANWSPRLVVIPDF